MCLFPILGPLSLLSVEVYQCSILPMDLVQTLSGSKLKALSQPRITARHVLCVDARFFEQSQLDDAKAWLAS